MSWPKQGDNILVIVLFLSRVSQVAMKEFQCVFGFVAILSSSFFAVSSALFCIYTKNDLLSVRAFIMFLLSCLYLTFILFFLGLTSCAVCIFKLFSSISSLAFRQKNKVFHSLGITEPSLEYRLTSPLLPVV